MLTHSKRLIVNADGFGFTAGNNRAIFEVAAAGGLSSISVNANFPYVAELPRFHASYPHISIGVHLNPVVGPPVSTPNQVATLLAPGGQFWHSSFASRLTLGAIALDELRRELLAQVRVVAQMGIPVTHLDSHQNQHLRPGFFEVFIQVANETGVKRMRTHRHYVCAECRDRRRSALHYYGTHPRTAALHLYTRYLMFRARRAGLRMADRLISVGHATGAHKDSIDVWWNVLHNLPSGVSEIYCHPGYVDDTLRKYARYLDARELERQVLVSASFRDLLIENQVELVSFGCI